MCSSGGDSGNADCRRQRNNSDFLPLAALRPPQTQSLYLDGKSNPQNSSTPTSECLRPSTNDDDDDDAPVSDAVAVAGGDPTQPTTPFPLLVLTVLLALFWVWLIDEARPRLRLRRGAAVREKGGCRCRVCTLRIQARGQPLHDVSENVA